MRIFNKITRYRQQQQQRKSFIFALGKYFIDVAYNEGKNTHWILEELESSKHYCKHAGREHESKGIEAAIEIIDKYREWEGRPWKGQ